MKGPGNHFANSRIEPVHVQLAATKRLRRPVYLA